MTLPFFQTSLSGSCIVGGVVLLYLTKYLMIGSLRGKF